MKPSDRRALASIAHMLALALCLPSCYDDIRLGGRSLTFIAPDDAGPQDGPNQPTRDNATSNAQSKSDAPSPGTGQTDRTPPVDGGKADDASTDLGASDVFGVDAPRADEDGGDSEAKSVCGAPVPPLSVRPPKRVVTLYLAAPDTPVDDVLVRRAAFERALVAVQRWFAESMSPNYPVETFHFEPPRVVQSAYTRSEWFDFDENGFPAPDGTKVTCGLWAAAQKELGENGVLGSLGLPPVGEAGTFYVVLAGGGVTHGCRGSSISVVEEMLADRVRAHCPNGVYDSCAKRCSDPGGLGDADPLCEVFPSNAPGYGCMMVGALANHIAYGFGLRPPTERTEEERALCEGSTIMDQWWNYGRSVTLCDPDKRDLVASGFVAGP